MKYLHRTIIGTCLLFSVSAVQAQAPGWQFGIGTGFYGINFDGNAGFQTPAGLVEGDFRLTTGDTADLIESAIGFGGYARNGRWTINFGYGELELEDDARVPAIGSGGTATLTFNKRGGEITAAYLLNESRNHMWSVLGGIRYTNHEWKGKLEIVNTPTARIRSDESWSDVVLGVTHAHPLSQDLLWSTRLDYSAGDSEGVASFNTGIGWQFSQSWSARFYASFSSIEFENHSSSDPDYYVYDADEFGAGVTILYNF